MLVSNTGVVPNAGLDTKTMIADLDCCERGINVPKRPYSKDFNFYKNDSYESEEHDSDGYDSGEHDSDGYDSGEQGSDGHESDEQNPNGQDSNGHDSGELDLEEHDSDNNDLEEPDSDNNDLDEYDSENNDSEGHEETDKTSTATLPEHASGSRHPEIHKESGNVDQSENLAQSGKLTQFENFHQALNLRQLSNPDNRRKNGEASDDNESLRSDATTLVESPSSKRRKRFNDDDEAEMHYQNSDFITAEELRKLAEGSQQECIKLYKESMRLKAIKLEKENEFRIAEEIWLRADRDARKWKMNKMEVSRILMGTGLAALQKSPYLEHSQEPSQSQPLSSPSASSPAPSTASPAPSTVSPAPSTVSLASTVLFANSCYPFHSTPYSGSIASPSGSLSSVVLNSPMSSITKHFP